MQRVEAEIEALGVVMACAVVLCRIRDSYHSVNSLTALDITSLNSQLRNQAVIADSPSPKAD